MAPSSPASVPPIEARALDRPRRLDRYELIAPIGSGGMATVYLGRATGAGGFERLVAIKLCHMHLRQQQGFVSMFLDEARLAARIHHPNVVATLDVRDDEELYIVMEYVEGGHLAQILGAVARRGEQVPIPIVLRIVHDALEGLHAAHEIQDAHGRSLNLVHRDVSPQNMLVGSDGITRIADFGVARAEERAAQTKPGEVKGKYSYMAPEQLRGLEIDRRADVFGAAVVLWEALSGSRLFKGDTSSDTMALVLSGPVRKPSSLRKGIPAKLDAAVKRSLERSPSRRFPSARELASELASCGVGLASPSDVAGYVSEVLAESIESQRRVARQSPSSGGEGAPVVISGREPGEAETTASTAAYSGVRLRKPRRVSLLILAFAGLLLVFGLSAWTSVRLLQPGQREAPPPAAAQGPPAAASPERPPVGGRQAPSQAAEEGAAGANLSHLGAAATADGGREGSAVDGGAGADGALSREPEQDEPRATPGRVRPRPRKGVRPRGGKRRDEPASEEPSFTRI